jgi:hypothetical protein
MPRAIPTSPAPVDQGVPETRSSPSRWLARLSEIWPRICVARIRSIASGVLGPNGFTAPEVSSGRKALALNQPETSDWTCWLAL